MLLFSKIFGIFAACFGTGPLDRHRNKPLNRTPGGGRWAVRRRLRSGSDKTRVANPGGIQLASFFLPPTDPPAPPGGYSSLYFRLFPFDFSTG